MFEPDDYQVVQEDFILLLTFFAEQADGINVLSLNPQLRVDTMCGRCAQSPAVCSSAVGGLMCKQCRSVPNGQCPLPSSYPNSPAPKDATTWAAATAASLIWCSGGRCD